MKNYIALRIGVLLTIAIQLVSSQSVSADEPVDFNAQIRPLLSNRCFACHGPDENERAAELRLDTKEGALDWAVVPGDPDDSELLQRIISDDEDTVMPPHGKGDPFTKAESELIARWISEGASYARHWSYVKPVRPEVPDGTHPIDHFVQQRLAKESLQFSVPADRRTLARRVALDLTGLPPTAAEVENFVADQNPKAYEHFVDQLLQRKTFGEHWARMWLDLARYADSAGYADDGPRTIWAYRDYVIRSFNENKPFDQFTIEQLAGDLLDNPREEQLVATAFHRNTQTNSEGGTNDEEFRNVAVVDRVNTTFATWMGTTMACAQCHTHKYDPITHEEYYRVFAILNQTQDSDKKDERPILSMYSEEQEKRKAQLREKIAAFEKELEFSDTDPALLASLAQWEKDLGSTQWRALEPTDLKATSGADLAVQDDRSIFASGKKAKVDEYSFKASSPVEKITAVKIELLTDDRLPGSGPARGGNLVLNEFTLESDSTKASFSNATASFEQSGFEAPKAVDGKPGKNSGWGIAGGQGRNHEAVFQLSTALPAGELVLKFKQTYPDHPIGRFRVSVTDAAEPDPALSEAIARIIATATTEREPGEKLKLIRYFANQRPESVSTSQQIAGLRKKLDAIKPRATVPVLREVAAAKRRKTHIHQRGSYLSHGAEVQPGFPVSLAPATENESPDRLELAQWLVSKQNPLTARVVANRYWEKIFGIGIVATSEEFGSQGESPSHPELLDWLAVEFRDSGWDTKAFLKLLVTSRAYRQSSNVTKELAANDPANRMLARGPRVRLSAEMVRDQALAVSGLLSPKMFGPPVRPPQPDMGVKAAFGGNIDWKTSEGEDRFRRGIYTTWRRSNPYPSMVTFDAPNREVCTVRRDRTNTPLQALVTLNDPVYIEAAQALARRMAAASDVAEEQLAHGVELCLSREPGERELERLVQFYEQTKKRYAADESLAEKMATNPIGPVPDGANVVDLAALTLTANVLLNLDEMLMKR